jgi:HEPN domain-containing protein
VAIHIGPGKKDKAHVAFDTAAAFHEAALRCLTEVKDPNTGRVVMPLSPAIANAGLASELYLKALALSNGEKPWGHDLHELFNKKLNDEQRQKITDRYLAITKLDRERLNEHLVSISDSFTQWRYIFEAPRNVSTNSLFGFARAAYETARELMPDWTVSDYKHERIVAKHEFDHALHIGGGVFIQSKVAGKVGGDPQPDVSKTEDNSFQLTALRLVVDCEAPTVDLKPDRGSDPEDASAR